MNKPKLPLVSVIMPVHNAGEFLVEAIESILSQTYRKLELIVVDDASTDNSWEIIKSYQLAHPGIVRIFRIRKQTNAAGNGAMNYGLKYARGQFIARMDADDISLPTRIEKQVNYLLKHRQTVLVGTQAWVINKQGETVGVKHMPIQHKDIYAQYGVFHPIIHPTVMLRRSLLPDPARIYEMKWNVNDDYYTFFKLLNNGKFANLPEKLLRYRVHGANYSLSHPKQKFYYSVRIRLEAVRKLNYQISPRAVGLMILQVLLISLLPEPLIVPTYLIIRGIKTPLEVSREAWVNFWPKKLQKAYT